MSDLNIAMILRLVDQVTGPSRRVVAAMRDVGTAVDGAGRGMLGASSRIGEAAERQTGIIQRQALGMAAMAGAAYSILRPAVEFEASMARVGAVSRASDSDLARLTSTARDLGATTPWAASQAAEGMQYLAQAGFSVNDTIAAMPGMLNLASAGATDLGRTSDIASNILSGFALEAAEMGRVGDILTNTFTASNTNLSMLGETMKYVAPSAAAVGMSLEEAAAMAGKLGDAGIQGSMAGTALRAMISRLAGPTGGAADALAQLSIETSDADGNLRPMIDVLAEMDAAMGSLGSAEQASLMKSIFGEEASAAAQVLMIQAGNGALQDFADRVSEQGSAARVAEEQNDNLQGMLKEVRSVTEAVSITIGTLFLPALKDMTSALIPMLQSIDEWAEANPEMVTALGQLALWMGGLKVASLALRVAFVTLAGPVKIVLTTLGWILRIAAVANPFGLWILGATALAAAIFAPWDKIAAYIDEKLSGFSLYDSGKAMIQTLWDGARSLIGNMVADLLARIRGIVPDWMMNFVGAETDGVPAPAALDTRGPMTPRRADESYSQNNTITITPHPHQDPSEIAAEVIRQQNAAGGRMGRAQQLTDTPEDSQ